ncbi:hypothetical protein IU469_31940 [Nocardia puris]|uniref:hypothetical protein n=1 Tax=Nocardia puris TaxID=208602 RepID=UPI0018938D43|nr:hypothetical protein [Nocardia puris]MBF6370284.1 hypothetical protein [Nocardia puris]
MTTVSLWFPRADVLGLAEHAMAATEHSLPPYDNSGGPSLIWVKDSGIYLLSNGLPLQAPTDTDPPDNKMHVVYAHGHGHGTHWDYGPPFADDFVEYLPLTESSSQAGSALIDMLRDPAHPAWFVITVHADTFTVDLTDGAPSRE